MDNLTDQIIYSGCWAILFLYIAATLLVFVRRSCIGYAASFLFACALWLDLTLFNLWFLLPAFYHHLRAIDPRDASAGGCSLIRAVMSSNALEDLGLMVLGWLASSLSISNSLSMWEVEGCENTPQSHSHHGGFTGLVMRFAVRVKEYIGIEEDEGIASLRIGDDGEPVSTPRRKSVLFAFPRYIHKYIPLPRRASPPSDGAESEYPVEEKVAIRFQDPDDVV